MSVIAIAPPATVTFVCQQGCGKKVITFATATVDHACPLRDMEFRIMKPSQDRP